MDLLDHSHSLNLVLVDTVLICYPPFCSVCKIEGAEKNPRNELLLTFCFTHFYLW